MNILVDYAMIYLKISLRFAQTYHALIVRYIQKNYFNNQNFNAITSKFLLKNMLYDFHNSVNNRKGFELFNRIDLDKKYNEQVLSVTFYNFLIKFKDRGASNRFIHEDIYRSQLSKELVKWFNVNKEYFDE